MRLFLGCNVNVLLVCEWNLGVKEVTNSVNNSCHPEQAFQEITCIIQLYGKLKKTILLSMSESCFRRLFTTFMCIFQDHVCLIFDDFPGLFNRLVIELVRYVTQFIIIHKQPNKPSLTADNDNVYKSWKQSKHVHGSKMRHPFRWFSPTFQNLGLIPWLSRRGKFKFYIPWLSRICTYDVIL